MNRKELGQKDYVRPHIKVFESEFGSQLLLGSKVNGGHEDAEDEEFESGFPNEGGHEDAEDEAW
ncbi:hypothetical protein J5A66_06110 [Prevotella sp. oral taxon 475]|jgi:hypothetical protein|uniref:hypothetical protein n=1 Tax=Prevotella sp. oral taxon 475 TaxID=712471 RepID=UPI001BAD70CF|nr:hypothetical protein [Prevotella sp. oral taxon 475]QUB46570.1 hypothetical protein J5A66_06110 [Prevotella sp. oral taxon 475]